MEKENKKTITIYNHEGITSGILNETIKRYEAKDNFEINFCKNPTEIRQLAEISPCMMIFVGLNSKKNVADIITVCTWLKKFINLNFVKILICGNHNPRVENFFRKSGVSDFIENDISQKSLEYKINLIFKTMKNNYEKHLNYSKKNRHIKTFNITDIWIGGVE